ncbi:PP2C family serine/threonine-protein phosphatase [Actinophytocola algeriensis]|uniref:Serine/threonine protein phosphatase PrpC n=1 Tax=Actinophytocola algeriensis TaxID=1768010 RepID=A0A7W7Q8Y7_9PSEU|nr:protein phosphatase 2C domain-containing protein [Actinophytocola algeriensis]MBB4909260.1 serine/threonine protein phosphatase PrpC [Actinophytocola algeriensis]MBE1474352.1 serine/threonine protein phosphatase PrpC [Actinophytocola algeriensis]
MTSCPGCGAAVGQEDRFCESCGQSLLVRRTPVGGPVNELAGGACVACGGENIDADGFCADCGRAQPSGRDRMESDLGMVVGVSDKGRRRARNEDSMSYGTVLGADAPPTVVGVVCDGVATSDRADSASQRAVDEALGVLLDAVLENGDAEEATRAAVAKAIEVVSELADPSVPGTAPSCTFVSAVVTPEKVTVGSVGDSRVYWIAAPDPGPDAPRELHRGAMPSQVLTADDTVAAELIAEGMSPEEANAVHQAHALSKWIGADAGDIEPRVVTVEPGGPGFVLLCSDGLWNYVPDAAALAEAMPEEGGMVAAAGLTKLALDLGGHDNITTVIVPFPPTEGTE